MGSEMQDGVKTAGRTLDLFEVFARQRGPLTLSELAQQLGAPVSSTHALVSTLRARGYVYVLEDRKLIYPTKRIHTIGVLIAANDPVIELTLPLLEKLEEQSGETLILGKRQLDSIIYIEVVESRNSIRYSARPGDTKPLHASAIGKAMLSLLPDDTLLELLSKAALAKATSSTITDPHLLLEDIRTGRERHIFVTRGENVADVMAMAVPIQLGGESFGIAIAGPMQRMIDKERDCAALLAQARRSLTGLDRKSAFD